MHSLFMLPGGGDPCRMASVILKKKKKKLNPRDRTGNITVCFNCGCWFHWSYDCPYGHSSRNKHGVKIEEDFSVPHVVLISKQKQERWGHFFE